MKLWIALLPLFIWDRLENTPLFVGNFLESQNITNCFGVIPSPDSLLLKCWRNNLLLEVQLAIHYFL